MFYHFYIHKIHYKQDIDNHACKFLNIMLKYTHSFIHAYIHIMYIQMFAYTFACTHTYVYNMYTCYNKHMTAYILYIAKINK